MWGERFPQLRRRDRARLLTLGRSTCTQLEAGEVAAARVQGRGVAAGAPGPLLDTLSAGRWPFSFLPLQRCDLRLRRCP